MNNPIAFGATTLDGFGRNRGAGREDDGFDGMLARLKQALGIVREPKAKRTAPDLQRDARHVDKDEPANDEKGRNRCRGLQGGGGLRTIDRACRRLSKRKSECRTGSGERVLRDGAIFHPKDCGAFLRRVRAFRPPRN